MRFGRGVTPPEAALADEKRLREKGVHNIIRSDI